MSDETNGGGAIDLEARVQFEAFEAFQEFTLDETTTSKELVRSEREGASASRPWIVASVMRSGFLAVPWIRCSAC